MCLWTVVGCPDLQTSADVAVRYSADRSVAAVTCRRRPRLDAAARAHGATPAAAASWRLACSDRGWHGYIGNCSAAAADARLGAYRRTASVIAKFHYTDPTRTRPDFFCGETPLGPCGSSRVRVVEFSFY